LKKRKDCCKIIFWNFRGYLLSFSCDWYSSDVCPHSYMAWKN
jgi:hypothetical protein